MKLSYKFFRFILVIYLACVGYICFSSGNSFPSIPADVFGIPSDKVVHFLMFLPYPFLVYLSFDKLRLFYIPLSGVMITGFTEIIQIFIPYREAEFLDFAADALSIILGSVVLLIIDHLVRRKLCKSK